MHISKAIKFQYNKTALQSLNKQLNVRLKALPTLKNKEAALRLEVKKAKDKTNELEHKLSSKLELNIFLLRLARMKSNRLEKLYPYIVLWRVLSFNMM